MEKMHKLERSARKLLGIPTFPDGATGPRSRALLAEIEADRAALGDDAAMRKHAKYCTLAHACTLPEDPPEHKAHAQDVDKLKDKAGKYVYPASRALKAAMASAAKDKLSNEERDDLQAVIDTGVAP